MKFSIAPAAFLLVNFFCLTASAEMVPYTKQWDVKLQRLPPSQVLTKLDLDRPGLQAVKAAWCETVENDRAATKPPDDVKPTAPNKPGKPLTGDDTVPTIP